VGTMAVAVACACELSQRVGPPVDSAALPVNGGHLGVVYERCR